MYTVPETREERQYDLIEQTKNYHECLKKFQSATDSLEKDRLQRKLALYRSRVDLLNSYLGI